MARTKVCEKARNEVGKHTSCVFSWKSKLENPRREQVDMWWGQKCVKKREMKSENTRHVFLAGKAS